MTSSDNSLIMYSTSWCGYCHRLKTAFKSENISYTEVDIEADPQGVGPQLPPLQQIDDEGLVEPIEGSSTSFRRSDLEAVRLLGG